MDAALLNDRLRRVTSRQNTLVKDLRKAFARSELTDEGYCAIESVRMVEEAIRGGLPFRAIFFRESSQRLARRLLPQIAARVETIVLPDEIFASAVATESPQGVAALVKLKTFSLEDVLRALEPLVLAVTGLQDPGNLGTILRSAEAFGASGVLLSEGTVSQFNAKTIRASAGSVFRVRVITAKSSEMIRVLKERGLRLLGTSSHKGIAAPTANFSGAVALFIGGEGGGLPREIAGHMEETVAVPHSPKVESLNVAVAASILLYEAARQRKS